MANTLSAITRITGTTGTGASTAPTFTGGTQLNKMFHFCSFRYTSGASLHDQTYKDTELTATNTLTIRAGQASGNVSATYLAYIVSFTSDSDLVVQRQTITDTAETVNLTWSPTLSALSRSFLIPHGETNVSDTTIGSEENYRYEMTSTTAGTLQVDDGNEGLQGYKFEVVDWGNDDIRVQHVSGNMTTAESTDTATLSPAVVLAKTFVIGTHRTEGGAFSEPPSTMCVRADLQNTTTFRVRRNATGEQLNWTGQAIEDISAGGIFDVDAGNISLAAATASGTLTIGAVDTARTVVLGSHFSKFGWEGQASSTTAGDPDNAIATVDLTNSTTIEAERGATSGTLDIIVQAIEFLEAGGVETDVDAIDHLFVRSDDAQERVVELLFTDGMDFFDPDTRGSEHQQRDGLLAEDPTMLTLEKALRDHMLLSDEAKLVRAISKLGQDFLFLRDSVATEKEGQVITEFHETDHMFLRDALGRTENRFLAVEALGLPDSSAGLLAKLSREGLLLFSRATIFHRFIQPGDTVFLLEQLARESNLTAIDQLLLLDFRRSLIEKMIRDGVMIEDSGFIELFGEIIVAALDGILMLDQDQRETCIQSLREALLLLEAVEAVIPGKELERSTVDNILLLTVAVRDAAIQQLDLVLFADTLQRTLEKIVRENLFLSVQAIVEKGKEVTIQDGLLLDETRVSEIDKVVGEQILFADALLKVLEKLIQESILLSDSALVEVSEAIEVVERAVVDSILLASRLASRELDQGRDVQDSLLLSSAVLRDMLKTVSDRFLISDRLLTQKATGTVVTDRLLFLDRLREDRSLTGFDRLLINDLTMKTREILLREGALVVDTVTRTVTQAVVDALIFALIRSRDLLGIQIASEIDFLGVLIDATIYAETSFSRWRKDI